MTLRRGPPESVWSADEACLEITVSPLELQELARDPPSCDAGELHGWTDRRRQVSEDALDLLALEETVNIGDPRSSSAA